MNKKARILQGICTVILFVLIIAICIYASCLWIVAQNRVMSFKRTVDYDNLNNVIEQKGIYLREDFFQKEGFERPDNANIYLEGTKKQIGNQIVLDYIKSYEISSSKEKDDYLINLKFLCSKIQYNDNIFTEHYKDIPFKQSNDLYNLNYGGYSLQITVNVVPKKWDSDEKFLANLRQSTFESVLENIYTML